MKNSWRFWVKPMYDEEISEAMETKTKLFLKCTFAGKMLIFPYLDKRMGVCITLRICRVSNEDEMLIIRFPQNLFAYIGMVITRWFWGAKWFVSLLPPHLHINIYCFLIGPICIWPSRLVQLIESVILLAVLAQCVAGMQLYVFCVWMCMFSDRRTTSTCSCVSPSSCCTAMMSQSSSSLQIKCCCTLVTSPCTWMESWCWGRYEHTHTPLTELLMVMYAVSLCHPEVMHLSSAAYKTYFSYSSKS